MYTGKKLAVGQTYGLLFCFTDFQQQKSRERVHVAYNVCTWHLRVRMHAHLCILDREGSMAVAGSALVVV